MIRYPLIKEYFKGTRYHILSIFLLALSIRLFLVWYLLGLDWRYNTGDGYEHAVFLDHIFKNSCYMPPGQYLFAGLINQFFLQPHYFLLRVATILLSALISINIYRIGKENFGHSVGSIAGYVSIVSLTFIFHSWTFYGTTLATCLFSFFILYFFRTLRFPERTHIILAGFFLGLSALTRAEMLVFFPMAFLWFLVVKGIRGESVRSAFKVLLFSLLVVFCWTVRNYLICDKFVLVSSNGPINFFIGNNPLQKGSYFPPIASTRERENYLLSGLIYDLEHPGWCVQFFKEKFKLYWSTRTRDHPKQLMESRFNSSAVKLFNERFEESRLNRFIQNPRLGGFYEFLVFLYSCLIGVFWCFTFLGLIYGHLFWQKSYFLIGICFAHALVFSLFFSGASSSFAPMLPYLYIIMAVGATSICKLSHLEKKRTRVLLYSNSFILLIILVGYVFRSLLIYHPVEKCEALRGLRNWNVVSIEENTVSLSILESQLSYPVKKGSLNRRSFSVWIGEKEIPHLVVARENSRREKFYFLKVKNLLCNNALIINVPHTLLDVFLSGRKSGSEKVVEEIVRSLHGKITVRYIPAWQFHRWIEKIIKFFLHLLQG